MKRIQLPLLPDVPPVVEKDHTDSGNVSEPEAPANEIELTREQFKALLHEITQGRKRDAFDTHMYEHAGFENYENMAKRYYILKALEDQLQALQQAQGRRKFKVKISFL